jgi:heat shock protein HslJ
MAKRTILGVMLLFAALVLSGCFPDIPPKVTLTNTMWVLSTLNDRPVVPDITVTARFQGGELSGIDGCNNYNTTYAVVEDRIGFDRNIATTLMACPEPIMQQSSAYFSALGKAVTFKITEQLLTLFAKDGQALAVFTRTKS